MSAVTLKQRSTMLCLAWFVAFNTVLFWLLGLPYLRIILASKTYFATTFYRYDSIFGKGLVYCFTVMTYLSHFALLAALPFLFVLLLILCRLPKKIIVISCVLIATFSANLLIMDSFVFSLFHFHAHLMLANLQLKDLFKLFNFMGMSQSEIREAACVIFLVFFGECFFIFFAQRITRFQPTKFYLTNAGCFVFSYIFFLLSITAGNNVLAQQTPNLPLYNEIIASLLPFKDSSAYVDQISETRYSQPLFASDHLHYPLHPLALQKISKPLNILIIGIDTWRYDAMDAKITPHIFKLANHAWYFKNHLSGGNSTQAGLFSLFYSLPSNYWTSMLNASRRPVFFDALAQQQYATKILLSSDVSLPPFNQTIFAKIPDLQKSLAPGATPMARDEYVTQAFKQFLQNRDKDRPFFTFLFYDSAHSYCQAKNLLPVYPMKQQACSRFIYNLADKDEAYNHYRNAVHFVDGQVSKVLEALTQARLDENTIVVITGDHGEEFDDSGLDFWGHGSNYTAYQVKTPLIMRWPNALPRLIPYSTNHYDLIPTLMQDVLNCKNSIADYSLGQHLLNRQQRAFVLVGSYINMGIVTPTFNMTLLTSGGVRTGYNFAAETVQLKPDVEIIQQALMLMRKYYQPMNVKA